jgi:cytochrome c
MKVNFKTSDPVRGARLYATTSNAKLLICADCHSDDPIVNNFGNIWSGRNSVDLIERAIYANTGGMGYLRNLLTYDDLVDIAAYLGNSPSSLSFDDTNLGAMSPEKIMTLSSSLKTGVDQLNLQTIGPFKLGQTTCGNAIPRFDACKVGLVFAPKTKGDLEGSLIIRHANSPVPIEIKLKAKGI